MRIARVLMVLVVLGGAAYFGVPLAGNQGGGGDPQPDLGAASGGGSGGGRGSADRADPAPTPRADAPASGASTTTLAQTQERVAGLMREKRSGQMVAFDARVLRTLADDNDGARHQRFILALEDRSGEFDTILVAHNIDLAERAPVKAGDIVSLYGQYEFNDRGGVLHWTHHDPAGRHEGGWIEHAGIRYE